MHTVDSHLNLVRDSLRCVLRFPNRIRGQADKDESQQTNQAGGDYVPPFSRPNLLQSQLILVSLSEIAGIDLEELKHFLNRVGAILVRHRFDRSLARTY